MKKTKLFKSLLLAAGMLAGSASAWAVTVTETYDFGGFITANGAPGMSIGSTVVATQSGTSTYTGGDLYLLNNPTNNGQTLDLNERFAIDYPQSAGVQIRFMWRSSGNAYQHGLAGNWNGNGTANTACHLSVLNLKAGDKITFSYAIQSGRAAQPYLCKSGVVTGIDADAYLSSGTEYTIAADGNLDIYFKNNNFAVSKIVIVTEKEGEEAMGAPSIDITAVNGNERTVTVTPGVGEGGSAATATYYTLDGTDPSSSNGIAYTAPFTITETKTIKAVSYLNETIGEITTKEVEAGTTVTLNAPAIYIASVTASGEKFAAAFGGSSNQSSVLLKPAATISATFNGEEVTLPYTPTEKGTLTITTSATGYASAETSMTVYPEYVQEWQSLDFSSLVGVEAVQAALDDTWSLYNHDRWASWNKDNVYNFYATTKNGTHNERLNFRNVILLAEGMGLGRNVTGGEAISVLNTSANDIVAFEIYNGFGNAINKGTNTYMSYVLSNGTDNPSMSSNNGALLVQATVYTPAKTTFTAKYYNSKGWEKVYAYTYNEKTLGEWAGTELTAGEDGLYNVTFESVDAPEKIVFNNGETGDDNPNKQQTGNLDFVDGAAYNFDGQGDIYSFTFTTNKGWSNVYAYTWSGADETKVEQLGAWNGKQLTATDGTYALIFVAAKAPEYIIFHNGEGAQTADLTFTNGEDYEFNSTFTVAGSNTDMFGTAWDVTNTDNDMTKNEDGTYSFTYTNVALTDNVLYKVVVDHAWDVSYPAADREIGISMAGNYDVTIHFDPSNGNVYETMAIYKDITSAGYATYYSPYDLNFEGTGVKAYVGTLNENTVTFSEVTSVKAGTGLLLKAVEGSYSIAMEESSNTVDNNALKGVLEDTKVPAGSFVLMSGTQGVGFYKAVSEFTVGANTAYIPALTNGGSRSFISLNIDGGTTTAIEGVATMTMESDAVFNLQGQRVVKAQKGLYIIGGKKVLVK